MSYRKYMTWEQGFAQVNEMAAKHKREMAMTNQLFPREDGKQWVNWIGLSQECRDEVYKHCYDLNTNKVR
tara:strand:+ start:319 stop:528 length:210 start_codon:yes stop_codon:yes gene_type:complete